MGQISMGAASRWPRAATAPPYDIAESSCSCTFLRACRRQDTTPCEAAQHSESQTPAAGICQDSAWLYRSTWYSRCSRDHSSQSLDSPHARVRWGRHR
jgi:hypothetical protein